MDPSLKHPHFRKATDVNREHPIFEFLDEGIILLDVSANDAGTLEVGFAEGICSKVFPYEKLMQLLAEGKKLVEEDLK